MERLTFNTNVVESSNDIKKYIKEQLEEKGIPFSQFEVLYTDKDFFQIVTNCSCSDKDHRLTIYLECERDGSSPSLSFDFQVGTPYSLSFWERIKYAVKLLFTGQIHMEESFIFRGREQLVQVINALITVANNFEDEFKVKVAEDVNTSKEV